MADLLRDLLLCVASTLAGIVVASVFYDLRGEARRRSERKP